MTCREKLKAEHPEHVNDIYPGGCISCPYANGYVSYSSCKTSDGECIYSSCTACWDQEIPETISANKRWAKDIREKYQNLRHEGFTSDEALVLLTAMLKGGNHNG